MTKVSVARRERLIVLVCPDCGRETLVEREDADPPTAMRAVLQCTNCDDGDFHSPEFFDGAGVWVHPLDQPETPQPVLGPVGCPSTPYDG